MRVGANTARAIKSVSIIIALLISSILGFSSSAKASDHLSVQGEVSYKSLTAICVVGTNSLGVQSALESTEEIAEFFESKGVVVHRFYDGKSDWDAIKKASKGANFFIYNGHGGRNGGGGKVGGLNLTSSVSSQTIIDELHLHKNALVVFNSVCNGAGSSAGDDGDIGIKEATTRVSDYSNPFFKTGAACYYANNLGSGGLKFLKNFFDGKTVKECFIESAKTWTTVEMESNYRYDSSKKISIASSDWGGTTIRTSIVNGVKTVEEIPSSKDYCIAYVAKSDYSLKKLMEGIR